MAIGESDNYFHISCNSGTILLSSLIWYITRTKSKLFPKNPKFRIKNIRKNINLGLIGKSNRD